MKDDKEIERILRGAWSPHPPDGMRERVLHGRRAETHTGWFMMNRLKLALASAWLLLVVAGGMAEHARHERVTAMVSPGAMASPRNNPSEWKRSIEGLLADSGDRYAKRGGPL